MSASMLLIGSRPGVGRYSCATYPVKSEVDDRLRDEAVVQFLRVVDLVPARHTRRVEVRDPLDVVLDRRDDIPVHDLGVVDVEQHLHAR